MRNSPIPVCIGILPSIIPGDVILIERTEGGIALPGGYIEEMEDVPHAINRECEEETELQLDISKWQPFFSAVTPDNKLLLFSYYKTPVEVPPAFIRNEEVVRVFSAPWITPLKFSLHEQALQKWAQIMLR
jgi:8-oxo-dGTP pyrophosphatase MutT (NUDIX family)